MTRKAKRNLVNICLALASSLILSACPNQPKSIRPAAPEVPLVMAVKKGDVSAVKHLLDSGDDPNMREVLLTKPSYEEHTEGGKPYRRDTVLMLAIQRGDEQIFNLLLERGADVNQAGLWDYTPLMESVSWSEALKTGMTEQLLEHGAKPNLRNDHGDTAIVFAANMDRKDLVELLLKYGADVNGSLGTAPLMLAISQSDKDLVEFLIKKGADVNIEQCGYTPLEKAIIDGNKEIAALIRNAGGQGRSEESLRKKLEQEDKEWQEKQNAKRQVQPVELKQELTIDDRQVIERVLLDLLAYKGNDFFTLGNPDSPDIILADQTVEGRGLISDRQLNNELDVDLAMDVSLEIREQLFRRNTAPVSIATFRPVSRHILLRSEDTLKSAFVLFSIFLILPDTQTTKKIEDAKKVRAVVEIWLPGYTRQKDRAVLRFWFGPTVHGAAGTFCLVKQDGRWRVKWRKFTYFM